MSETNNNEQGQKIKLSRPAIVSLLLSFLGVCLLVLVLYGFDYYRPGRSMPFYLRPLYVYGHLVSGLVAIAGIAAGIFAIKQIHNKRRILKGRRFAVSGMLLGLVFLPFWVWHLPSNPFTARKRCAANLRALGRAMLIYAGDYDEQWPTADKWCDLLIESKGSTERNFKCPANKKKRCSYAINPNASKRSNFHPRLVLLFETETGWNQFGGPELLTTDNHNGKGCNVLFNDNSVEFVKTQELAQLKWKAEQNIK